ncbi:MAG TPA: hypothetical protein VFZ26_05370 [Gemmatimonadales bacterium]
MIPNPIRTLGTAALVLAALAGCGDRKPAPPKMAEVFPNLPLPPGGRFLGSAAGEDALQVRVLSAHSRSSVESYYRTALTQNGWRLVNEAKDREGALVFLAERDGPPLWVRIRTADDGAATLVEFSGARMPGAGKPAS